MSVDYRREVLRIHEFFVESSSVAYRTKIGDIPLKSVKQNAKNSFISGVTI